MGNTKGCKPQSRRSESSIIWLQGPDFTAVATPPALIISVESLQFRPDICWSLLILHGTKPNYREMPSLHASLDRYKYLRGSFVHLFLEHEMNVNLWGLEISMNRIAWSPKRLASWVCLEVERCDVTYQQRECPWQPAPGFLGDTVLWQGASPG